MKFSELDINKIFIVFFIGTSAFIVSIYAHNPSELVPIFLLFNLKVNPSFIIEIVAFLIFLILYSVVLFVLIEFAITYLISEFFPSNYEKIKKRISNNPTAYSLIFLSVFLIIAIISISYICSPPEKFLENTGNGVIALLALIGGTIIILIIWEKIKSFFSINSP
jgi:hypothetical protein